ncbi:MAG: hypothetical protein FD123_367 [Bacteroidetes bacterium]|nr:MAG: hypothetical protein FD123_367 [Bacteroidota bacterium]
MKIIPRRDIHKLFPVGLKDWLKSKDCHMRKNYVQAISEGRFSKWGYLRLLEAYPEYQHWFQHEGFRLVTSPLHRKKYKFLICPVGSTALPETIKQGMKEQGMRSVHELLLTYDYLQMRMYEILHNSDWKDFIRALHHYRCYDMLEV